MSSSASKTTIDARGITAGVLLAISGSAAAFHALSFDADSRMFPFTVATLLAMTGAGIILKTVFSQSVGFVVTASIRPAAVAAAIITVWAAAFSGGAGFVLPTFLMQAALLYLAGLRRPAYIAGTALLVTVIAYLLFVALLDIPLPLSRLPPVFQDF